jgi:NAD(P)-dependent dehydrogenase (short-subunit alcohol dehydrogenase family)
MLPESIDSFAERFNADGGRLDLLMLNAGIGIFDYKTTADGTEHT